MSTVACSGDEGAGRNRSARDGLTCPRRASEPTSPVGVAREPADEHQHEGDDEGPLEAFDEQADSTEEEGEEQEQQDESHAGPLPRPLVLHDWARWLTQLVARSGRSASATSGSSSPARCSTSPVRGSTTPRSRGSSCASATPRQVWASSSPCSSSRSSSWGR